MALEKPSGPLARMHPLVGGFVSVLAVVLLLVIAVVTFWNSLRTLGENLGSTSGVSVAVEAAINDALLLLIIGELLITVTQKANLVRQLLEFLVIGVTTLVRHALQLVLRPETSRSVVPDLLLDSAAILVLVLAFLAVRVVEAHVGGSGLSLTHDEVPA